MFWLGARKLAGFQLTGAGAGEDLLVAGPSLLPDALAGWFRCRPTGVFLNLIRKELRLLRPLWLITSLAVLYVACMGLLKLLPVAAQPNPSSNAQLAAFAPLPLLFLLIAILAGSLPLGEERTSGTHSWQMTLPVSVGRQWLVKLGVAVFAGLACAVLLPLLALIATGTIYGSPIRYVELHALPHLVLAVLFVSLCSFWCACAASGTMRAAILVFPIAETILLARDGGGWVGRELARTTGTLRDLVVSWLHLSPLSFPVGLGGSPELYFLGLYSVIVPVTLFGVIQSYRLFRVQPQDRILSMLRCVLPVALVALLGGFLVSAGYVSSWWDPFGETWIALQKFQPAEGKLEVSGDDLTRDAALSPLTRRWLRGSSIALARDGSQPSVYHATIRLAGGLECRLAAARFNNGLFIPERESCAPQGP
jgi:hypothetical protein